MNKEKRAKIENLLGKKWNRESDNTGSGTDVVTWLFSYTTEDGPFTTRKGKSKTQRPERMKRETLEVIK